MSEEFSLTLYNFTKDAIYILVFLCFVDNAAMLSDWPDRIYVHTYERKYLQYFLPVKASAAACSKMEHQFSNDLLQTLQTLALSKAGFLSLY